jgi:hypothetical protein
LSDAIPHILSFHIWKHLLLCKNGFVRYFETRFLEEADEFLSGLDKKSVAKILYNMDLAEQTNDPRLFKKLQDEIGNSE